jgi:hypothetical protein
MPQMFVSDRKSRWMRSHDLCPVSLRVLLVMLSGLQFDSKRWQSSARCSMQALRSLSSFLKYCIVFYTAKNGSNHWLLGESRENRPENVLDHSERSDRHEAQIIVSITLIFRGIQRIVLISMELTNIEGGTRDDLMSYPDASVNSVLRTVAAINGQQSSVAEPS